MMSLLCHSDAIVINVFIFVMMSTFFWRVIQSTSLEQQFVVAIRQAANGRGECQHLCCVEDAYGRSQPSSLC